MARRNLSAVIRYLRELTGSTGPSGASDAELLERYVRHGDDAAFELLLWRHGTLVFNVCRRILPREQDAEDAFQATFLVFVRKASTINRRSSIASWLYKVAYRIALEAKERLQKTATMENLNGDLPAVSFSSDPAWSDVRPILDEELSRLPERLRQPIVLCYLEGKSNAEAARELGCRLGTIYSRLSRGREQLRQRLQRRGVTLSVAALTAALTASAVEAAPAIGLVRMASAFVDPSVTAVISPRVAALTEGALRTMFVTKLKIAAVMILVVSLAAGSVLTYARTAAPQLEAKAKEEPQKPAGGEKKEAAPITVKVIEPKKGGMMLMVSRPAEVVAAQQQQVVPLVSGTIKEVSVDIGDSVKKGQTLIVLDAPLLVKEREQAEHAFKIAKVEVEEARVRIQMAQAEVKAAEALYQVKKAEIAGMTAAKTRWDTEVQRIAKQAEKGIVDPQVLQESQAQLAVAEAKVKAAEAAAVSAEVEVKIKAGRISHAKAALEIAIAAAESAKTVVEKARIQEGFTQLKAAFDGAVTRRTIDAGNFVQPSDSRLLRPLLTVQRIDTVRLVVRVANEYAPLVKRGMRVEVDMPGIQGSKLQISRFSPSLEGTDGMAVEIDVANADNRLLPGMRGTVELPIKKTSPEWLVVPQNCLSGSHPDYFVYIVRDGKVHRKNVTLGAFDGRIMEIRAGIKASDLVIIKPGELADGTPVKIEKTP
jgi:RNA polymerase sigma factor (sigma-70 family)